MRTAPSLLAQGALQRLGVGSVYRVVWIDEDRILVLARGGAVLRRTLDGAIIWEVDCPASCGALLLPQGHVLLCNPASGQLERWDLARGDHAGTLDGAWPGCNALVASPDGDLLALGTADGQVVLVDGRDGLERACLTPHMGSVRSLAFSPDGRLLAVASVVGTGPGVGAAVAVWDLTTCGIVHQLQAGSRRPFGGQELQFSSDGRFLAWVDVADLQRWALAPARQLPPLSDPPLAVAHFTFSPDGHTLALGTLGRDHAIQLWDHEERHLLGSLPQAETAYSLAFGPGGDSLAVSTVAGSLGLWDLRGAHLRWQQAPEPAICAFAAWVPGGHQLLIGAGPGRLLLWDYADPSTPRPVPSALPGGACQAVSPDGRWVAMATTARLDDRADVAERLSAAMAMQGGALWCLDLAGSEAPRHVLATTASITALAYTPDGSLVLVATSDGGLTLVEPETGRVVRRLAGHEGPIWSVDVSPQGDLLASAGADGAVRCWDVGGRELLRLDGPAKRWSTGIRFSPDGRQLAFGGPDHGLGVWEVPAGRLMLRMEQTGRWIGGLDFSPDGRLLAAGDERGAVQLWEVPGGRPLARLEGHTMIVANLEFHPDGALLVTGGGDGTVRIWRAPHAAQ